MTRAVWVVGLLMMEPAFAADLSWQGRLVEASGQPVSGTHDLGVSLWTASSGGSQVASTLVDDVAVEGGYVSLTLPTSFGAAVAANASLWIEVAVDGTALAPREPLRATPYAVVASRIVVTGSNPSGSCTDTGAITYSQADKGLYVCDGTWQRTTGAPEPGLKNTGGVRRWADGTTATSCNAYRNPTAPHTYTGDTGSGVYTLDVDGSGSTAPFDAYCDMVSFGGGWTLVGKVHGADEWWICDNQAACSGTRWRDATLLNQTDLGVTTAQDAKYTAYLHVAGSDVMFWDGANANPLVMVTGAVGNRTFGNWVATFPDPGASTSCGQEWAASHVQTGYRHPFCTTTNCATNARLGVFCRDEEAWSTRDFNLFALPNNNSFDYNYGNKPGLATSRLDSGHSGGTHVDVDGEMNGGTDDGRAWTVGAVGMFLR